MSRGPSGGLCRDNFGRTVILECRLLMPLLSSTLFDLHGKDLISNCGLPFAKTCHDRPAQGVVGVLLGQTLAAAAKHLLHLIFQTIINWTDIHLSILSESLGKEQHSESAMIIACRVCVCITTCRYAHRKLSQWSCTLHSGFSILRC